MLARALATRPRLLILDEPIANLDIAHQISMLELVKSLTLINRTDEVSSSNTTLAGAKESMSAIVVTHELNLAAEFSNRVLLLKAGEVKAYGPPAEVMTRERLKEIFETDVLVDQNPVSGAPRVYAFRQPISNLKSRFQISNLKFQV